MELHHYLWILSIGAFCAGSETGFNDNPSLDSQSYNLRWMEYIPDETPLSAVSIPGAHESLSLYGGPLSVFQVWNLEKQLLVGLRYFDVHCGIMTPTQEQISIWSGRWMICQHIQFDEILKMIFNFLDINISETVLLKVEIHGIYRKKVTKLMKTLISKFRYRTWTKLSVPNMQQVRGKIVFLQSNREKKSRGDGEGNQKSLFFRQNKLKNLEDGIKEMKLDLCDRHFVLTEPTTLVKKSPKRLARTNNYELHRLVVEHQRRSHNWGCLGVVSLDFPSAALIRDITELNPCHCGPPAGETHQMERPPEMDLSQHDREKTLGPNSEPRYEKALSPESSISGQVSESEPESTPPVELSESLQDIDDSELSLEPGPESPSLSSVQHFEPTPGPSPESSISQQDSEPISEPTSKSEPGKYLQSPGEVEYEPESPTPVQEDSQLVSDPTPPIQSLIYVKDLEPSLKQYPEPKSGSPLQDSEPTREHPHHQSISEQVSGPLSEPRPPRAFLISEQDSELVSEPTPPPGMLVFLQDSEPATEPETETESQTLSQDSQQTPEPTQVSSIFEKDSELVSEPTTPTEMLVSVQDSKPALEPPTEPESPIREQADSEQVSETLPLESIISVADLGPPTEPENEPESPSSVQESEPTSELSSESSIAEKDPEQLSELTIQRQFLISVQDLETSFEQGLEPESPTTVQYSEPIPPSGLLISVQDSEPTLEPETEPESQPSWQVSEPTTVPPTESSITEQDSEPLSDPTAPQELLISMQDSEPTFVPETELQSQTLERENSELVSEPTLPPESLISVQDLKPPTEPELEPDTPTPVQKDSELVSEPTPSPDSLISVQDLEPPTKPESQSSVKDSEPTSEPSSESLISDQDSESISEPTPPPESLIYEQDLEPSINPELEPDSQIPVQDSDPISEPTQESSISEPTLEPETEPESPTSDQEDSELISEPTPSPKSLIYEQDLEPSLTPELEPGSPPSVKETPKLELGSESQPFTHVSYTTNTQPPAPEPKISGPVPETTAESNTTQSAPSQVENPPSMLYNSSQDEHWPESDSTGHDAPLPESPLQLNPSQLQNQPSKLVHRPQLPWRRRYCNRW